MRAAHAPAETAAHVYREAEAARVVAEMADGGPHEAEVKASHAGSPTPAEAVAAGVTPPSSGFSGHGAPGP